MHAHVFLCVCVSFTLGGTAKPVTIDAALEHMAVQVTKRCKLDMAGIDVLMDQGTYKICEVRGASGAAKRIACDVRCGMCDVGCGMWDA